MKILTLFFLFIFSDFLFAQETTTIKNGVVFSPRSVDSVLQNLHDQNDYVIAFRLKLPEKSDGSSDTFVLTRKGSKLFAYKYPGNSSKLTPLNLSDDLLNLVWDTFIQNDLFEMKNEIDIQNFCLGKYQIYGSHTYEFMLINKDKMKKLSYYDPEYYDNACYGMAERKKIINCVAVITHVLDAVDHGEP